MSMTPKDKAEELVDKMLFCYQGNIDKYTAKQCALIAVDELIKETSFEVPNIRQRYWQAVKQEIENL
ncbi:hypothetical protein UFOVP388_12 [uncultured Caudovirales phage]|uniref:Uncharacterized protein n=1 Tax=uncultured Caudovirales phage TaxID=2100421 RepID=A0A6J7X0M5_9CAUD|nr:hypothetical protein UFOVP388_12 [uncultured Caudovirales phage]